MIFISFWAIIADDIFMRKLAQKFNFNLQSFYSLCIIINNLILFSQITSCCAAVFTIPIWTCFTAIMQPVSRFNPIITLPKEPCPMISPCFHLFFTLILCLKGKECNRSLKGQKEHQSQRNIAKQNNRWMKRERNWRNYLIFFCFCFSLWANGVMLCSIHSRYSGKRSMILL